MSKLSNNSPDSSPTTAAGVVGKIGLLSAKFTAKMLSKGVSAGVNATIDAVRGPKDYIVVTDTGNSASEVLYELLSWGVTKKYVSSHHISRRMSIFTLAQIVRNELLPKIPSHICLLKLGQNQEVNKFWETVLTQQMIPFMFQ